MTFRGKKLSDPSVRDVLLADVTDPDYLYFVDDETGETKRIRISVLKEVVGTGGGGIPAMNPVPAEGELAASDGAGGLVGTGSTVLEITDAIQVVQDAVDAISSPFPLDPVPTTGTVLITDPYGDPTTTTSFNPYALTTDQIVRGWGRLPAVAATSSAWRGTVGEMRGDVGEFVASALCDLNAVPVAAQDIWGNYELGTTTGGWGITVDATGFSGVVSQNNDGALITLTPVANYAPFSAYQAGEIIDRTALVTLQVIGTAATLWVNGQQVASATLTGGMRRADVALRAYVGRNNSVGTPRVATSVAVRGVYYYAAAVNTQVYSLWAAAQYSYVRARSGLIGGRAYGGTLNGSPSTADVFHITPVPGYLSQLNGATGGSAAPLAHATGTSYVADVLPVVWASWGVQGATADQWAHPPIVATIDDTDSPFTVLPEHAGGIIRVDSSAGFVEMNMPPALAATKPFRVGFELIDSNNGAEVTSDGVLTFWPEGAPTVGVNSDGITWVTLTDTTRGSVVADLLALEAAASADFIAGAALVNANNARDVADDALHPNVPATHTAATRTIALADAGGIIPFSGASNAVAINVPHTIFAAGGTGRAFVFGGVIRDLTNPITLAGTGGLVLYYYGDKKLLTAVGDTFIVKVISATEAWVYIMPRGANGIDYVEGFVADAGTAANRRGYTRGSDPLSATPSFTAVVVGRIMNTQFVAGGSRQLFGTRSAAGASGGGWCIFSEGTLIGLRFTDAGGVQRSASLVNATLAWRVLHLTVEASGADLTLTLFANGAQVSEVYVGGAGGQYTAGAEMCVGVLDEGAILPAALHNRIHGAGYATATMTQAEVAAHADAIIAAGQLIQTPSGTVLADGWRADAVLGTPAAATWASFLSGTALTTLNTTALTLAAQPAPLRWA